MSPTMTQMPWPRRRRISSHRRAPPPAGGRPGLDNRHCPLRAATCTMPPQTPACSRCRPGRAVPALRQVVTSFITEAGLTGTCARCASRGGDAPPRASATSTLKDSRGKLRRGPGRRPPPAAGRGAPAAAHWRASPRTTRPAHRPHPRHALAPGITGKPPFRKEPKVRWGKTRDRKFQHTGESGILCPRSMRKAGAWHPALLLPRPVPSPQPPIIARFGHFCHPGASSAALSVNPRPMNLLVFDTSTDASIAVQHGDVVWHTRRQGAQASVALIPAIQRLLAEAGLGFDTLDAIVFGRGPAPSPGCALPVRWRRAWRLAPATARARPCCRWTPCWPWPRKRATSTAAPRCWRCWTRMNEVYSAHCTWQEATRQWSTDADFGLCAPKR